MNINLYNLKQRNYSSEKEAGLKLGPDPRKKSPYKKLLSKKIFGKEDGKKRVGDSTSKVSNTSNLIKSNQNLRIQENNQTSKGYIFSHSELQRISPKSVVPASTFSTSGQTEAVSITQAEPSSQGVLRTFFEKPIETKPQKIFLPKGQNYSLDISSSQSQAFFPVKTKVGGEVSVPGVAFKETQSNDNLRQGFSVQTLPQSQGFAKISRMEPGRTDREAFQPIPSSELGRAFLPSARELPSARALSSTRSEVRALRRAVKGREKDCQIARELNKLLLRKIKVLSDIQF